MIEGSGSVPRTNETGSGRAQIMLIRTSNIGLFIKKLLKMLHICLRVFAYCANVFNLFLKTVHFFTSPGIIGESKRMSYCRPRIYILHINHPLKRQYQEVMDLKVQHIFSCLRSDQNDEKELRGNPIIETELEILATLPFKGRRKPFYLAVSLSMSGSWLCSLTSRLMTPSAGR
jgi:hypothetical protein